MTRQRIRYNKKDYWWTKVPWLSGLVTEHIAGEWQKTEAGKWKCIKEAQDGEDSGISPDDWDSMYIYEKRFIPSVITDKELVEGKDKHAVDTSPTALISCDLKQNLDAHAYMLIPYAPIVRQSMEDKGSGNISFQVPCDISSFSQKQMIMLKTWMKMGVHWQAILYRMGGFLVINDRETYNAFGGKVAEHPCVDIVYDAPGVAHARTYAANGIDKYRDYRNHVENDNLLQFLPENPQELFDDISEEKHPMLVNLS